MPEDRNELQGLKGLEKVYVMEETKTPSIEVLAGAAANAVRRCMPEVVLFAGTLTGNELGARVAAELERGFISGCTDFEVEGHQLLARKAVYGGKADALMRWETPAPHVAAVDAASLEDVSSQGGRFPEIVLLGTGDGPARVRLKGRWRVPPREMDLSEADVVIGVGKGVPRDFMDRILELSEALEAAVGGTRIAVHEGLISVEKQIGTTGKWLNSDVYLALGISGAPQHVMGLKKVRKTIAVNVWKGASIFQNADLGVVGDLLEVVPQMLALLKERRGKVRSRCESSPV